MNCEDNAQKFQQVMESVTQDFKNGLAATAANVEAKASAVANNATDGSDLAQGIGMAAGSAIGGVLAGAPGAAVGATIGKTIGSLFVIDFTEVTHSASMDIPEITLRDTEIKFDLPEIQLKDTDITFNLPTLVMRTIQGPDQPVPVCTTERRCISYRIPTPFGDIKDEKCTDVLVCKIDMRPTYYDSPTWEDREQRIVIGLPVITMKPQRVVIGIPEISMQRRDFRFNIPNITIRFMQDAGKATSAAVQAIQSDAQSEFAQKKIIFRERMRLETVPLAIAMFDCYKNRIREEISKISAMFDPQISQFSDSLKSVLSKGVPETDDDYIALKSQMDKLLSDRAAALAGLKEALAKLESTSAEAINRLVNEDFD